MISFTGIAIVVAFFFAMNIGASGTAAAMSGPYGSGAIQRRVAGQWLAGLFAGAGTIFGGGTVARTIGSGLIQSDGIGPELVLVILGSACITLFTANVLGIPLSTSEVTVGSVIGVGLAFQGIHLRTLAVIVSSWIVLPLGAFVITSYGRRISSLMRWKSSGNRKTLGQKTRWVRLSLVLLACYQAFAAGMNNAANAVGPLISARLMDETNALILGGIGLAAGAVFLGGNVLETNSKKLTRLDLTDAVLVAGSGATLVFIASLAGIPVPLTQTTTAGIMGVGWARAGGLGLNHASVSKTLQVWLLSPFASLFLSLGGATLVLRSSLWPDLGTSAAWFFAALLLLFLQAAGGTSRRREPSN